MSNDLLFPILPRNTKVPVEEDKRVKKVEKTNKTEHFSEEGQDSFDRVKQTDAIERRDNQSESGKDKKDPSTHDGLKHIDVDV
tara:strand:- start:1160 stop:1408 length:249 start_codon:yes stop_codon:yes gene_type:complete